MTPRRIKIRVLEKIKSQQMKNVPLEVERINLS